MLGRALAGLALALVPPTQSGCIGCTLVGCIPGASIELNTNDPVGVIEGSTLTLCIEDSCVGYLVPPAGQNAGDPFNPSAFSFWMSAGATGGADIFISTGERIPPRDGDLYSVELRASDGTLILARRWTARYERFYPNGKQCDDGCLRAHLTPAS
jgi:hypothetical protein